MTREAGLPGSTFLWRVVSLVALGAGGFLLATGRGPIPASIVLLVVGIAASAVLLGAAEYGPSVEGRLDLSARLGTGLLGGLLGGLAVVTARWILSGLGVDAALGVSLPEVATGTGLAAQLGAASVWGMVLGVLYPHVPGVSPGSRGARFSLLVSLYMLLKVYPLDFEAGWFAADFGALAFVFVFLLNMLWGSVAGATIGWAEEDEEAPVSRPIDA